MSATSDFVTRPELDATIDSLNREFSGLNTKMDTLLQTKFEDARNMGALQEQVRGLAANYQTQAQAIQRIETEGRKNQIAPRDALIKLLYDALKIAAGLLLGYLANGGKIHS
jgi:citrate synthase